MYATHANAARSLRNKGFEERGFLPTCWYNPATGERALITYEARGFRVMAWSA